MNLRNKKMQLQINKIVGIYNSKIIVIDTIFSEKHDGLFNLILSEFETISKRQIIKDPAILNSEHRSEFEILYNNLSEEEKEKLNKVIGKKGKDFMEFNFIDRLKELPKNGGSLGVCKWDCVLDFNLAKLLIANSLYGAFTANFAKPYLKNAISNSKLRELMEQ